MARPCNNLQRAIINGNVAMSQETQLVESTRAPTSRNDNGIPIGVKFIRSGLGLLVFGIFVGFGPIGHYMIGAQYNNGPMFLKNVGLWFACPWTLSVYAIQGGAAVMIALGAMYVALGRVFAIPEGSGRPGFYLCTAGLLTVFLTGYIGYFVVDKMYPSFYYTPIETGKNLWLISQALSIALYWLGIISILLNVRTITKSIEDRAEPGFS
jgi:hypothetical protein